MTGELRPTARHALAQRAFSLLVPDFDAQRRVRTYGRYQTHWRVNDVDTVERLASLPTATLEVLVASLPRPNPGASVDLAESAKSYVESFGNREDRRYREVVAALLSNHLAFADVLDALANGWWDYPFYEVMLRGLSLHLLGGCDEMTVSVFHEEHATKDYLASSPEERDAAAAFLLASGVTAQALHGFVPDAYDWAYRLEEPASAPDPELVEVARRWVNDPHRFVAAARARNTAAPSVLAQILTSGTQAVSEGWL